MRELIYSIKVDKSHTAAEVLQNFQEVAKTFGPVEVVQRDGKSVLQLKPDHSIVRIFLSAQQKLLNDQTVVELKCEVKIRTGYLVLLALVCIFFFWTIIALVVAVTVGIMAVMSGTQIAQKICDETQQRVQSPDTAERAPLSWTAP